MGSKKIGIVNGQICGVEKRTEPIKTVKDLEKIIVASQILPEIQQVEKQAWEFTVDRISPNKAKLSYQDLYGNEIGKINLKLDPERDWRLSRRAFLIYYKGVFPRAVYDYPSVRKNSQGKQK